MSRSLSYSNSRSRSVLSVRDNYQDSVAEGQLSDIPIAPLTWVKNSKKV